MAGRESHEAISLRKPFLELFNNEVACRIVLAVSLIITVAGWRISTQHVQQRARERFEFETEATKRAIGKRLLEYEQALYGGAGLFRAMGRPVSRQEWRAYVRTMQIQKYYPGIQSIGFAEWTEPAAKHDSIDKVRRDGLLDYELWPDGERDGYVPVVYIEPFDWRNRLALGYDMLSDPVRRAAMERSRDTGEPSVSGKVTLSQETGKDVQAGFVIYVPVYRGESSLHDVEERRAALLGFAFSSFRVGDLMQGTLRPGRSTLNFKIFDGSETRSEALLFDTQASNPREAVDPALTAVKSLQHSGRIWTIQFTSHPHFDAIMASHEPLLIALAGVGINLLLFSIFQSMAAQRRRMISLADKLRQSENRFRVMIDSVKDYAIFMLDIEGRVMTWNRGAEMTMGYKAEEVLGEHYSMFFSPEERENGKPEAILKTAYEEEQCDDTGWRLRREHSPFWANVVVSAVRNGGNRLLGYSHVTRDLTRRQKIIQELQAAKEDAEAANQAKSEFLANISHEIRTPMTGVIGMAGLLSETELTPLQRQYCDIILRSSGSLLTVINEVLDFSKVEAGKLELENIEFDVRSAVEEVTGLFAADAAAKDIELISFIRFDVPTAVKGDPSRLRQILSNLVNNALKFTTGGEVVVRVKVVSQTPAVTTLRFEVADTGIGISSDRRRGLFNPFTQLDASTTRKFGGTGLGLAICKKIVDLMQGEIGVDSAVGEGSVFWFTVPLLNQKSALRQPHMPRADLSNLRVIIVESNGTSRAVLTHYLDALGINAQIAADGPAALQMLRSAADNGEPYDLAVIDFRLPEMNGLELAQTIRQDMRFENLKLLLITSMGARGDAELAKQAGINAYLTKPISLSCLSECLAVLTGEASETDTSLITRHTVAEMKAHNRLRVLVADDNHINQKVTASLLEDMGHRADVVSSGKEALEAFILVYYEIVLMDLQMPEMDGFEACRRIRALANDTKRPVSIIAVTAHAMAGDKEKCMNMGFDGYISKPIIPKELRAVMASLANKASRALPPPVPEASLKNAVLDLAQALRQLEGNRQLLCEISQMFLEIYPALLKQIRDAAEAGDNDALRSAAHTLASSAGQIGATKAQTIAGKLEVLARPGEFSAVAAALGELEVEIRAVAAVLSDQSSPHYSWLHAEA